MDTHHFRSRDGIDIERLSLPVVASEAIETLVSSLDEQLGLLLASSYEYPGRYTRWDLGFVAPPLRLVARGRHFSLEALNQRGELLLAGLRPALALPLVELIECSSLVLSGRIATSDEVFTEEQRSRQPSVFSVLRSLLEAMASADDTLLGWYGAFGYDLAFQFEPVKQRLPRPPEQRDMVLYFPDELLVVDHQRQLAHRVLYDFTVDGRSTRGLPRDGVRQPYAGPKVPTHAADHAEGEYAACVRQALAAFSRGDLFETVPGQTFFEPCRQPPSELFRRLRASNPSPYGALINLGEGEYLVAASPEMFVRVEGDRVETCPIAGTIARGADPFGDAAQIRKLLESDKEESELTMCTDVDRNDKSRICRPGSVRVLGRRQLELYSRLIHTVDHVEGRLREGFDALDAFLAHSWAVTVTGAPKTWAMQFIEDHEKSPRAWYGGAIGYVRANGSLNTGITLRTIRVKDGIAEVRAGATLLHGSDPDAEERECRLKASALLAVLREEAAPYQSTVATSSGVGSGKRVLLIDHQDSFVHTLGGYLRETGAEVVTLRAGFPLRMLTELCPDLVLLSPGPGTPSDFGLNVTLKELCARGLPTFGVCLGLQGMVEYFGGRLAVLDRPMHGVRSEVQVLGGQLFTGLPRRLTVGRYHSLYAERAALPSYLEVTAETDDGVVMAIEHRELPMAAVQFHPESILTLEHRIGHRLLDNALRMLC
jgi:anthranilate synthase